MAANLQLSLSLEAFDRTIPLVSGPINTADLSKGSASIAEFFKQQTFSFPPDFQLEIDLNALVKWLEKEINFQFPEFLEKLLDQTITITHLSFSYTGGFSIAFLVTFNSADFDLGGFRFGIKNFGFAVSGSNTATATASVSDKKVVSITVANAGAGYQTAPRVQITGGGGTGATATASLKPKSVFAVNVDKGGSGYTEAPKVKFSSGEAKAAATVDSGRVTAVIVEDGGSDYQDVPTVSFEGGGGQDATAKAVLGAGVEAIKVGAGGSGYTSAPQVVIDSPTAALMAAELAASSSDANRTPRLGEGPAKRNK